MHIPKVRRDHGGACACVNTSSGVRKPSALRGRVLSRSSTAWTSAIGHRPEICAFRKVLADQSIGVFVQPALPGVVGPGKIELGIKRLGQADVASEFLAIVRSDCVNQVSIRFQSALDPRSNIFGRLPVDPCQAGQLRDAVYHRGHCTALTCSDNRVRLPVADPQLLFDDRRPLTDIDAPGNASPPGVATAAPVRFSFLAAADVCKGCHQPYGPHGCIGRSAPGPP